ncbi:MAG TPA: hypothetical protein VJ866_12215 [Pyrinomonadaceae bacterium]|nr:hypothetical protein [Pyrinomonadaceae bacterium]
MKTAEGQPESAALVKQFHASLKGANSHEASPAKVETFRKALDACAKAGALSECNLKTALAAACDFALESAKKTAGQAVPMIWEEQAREMHKGLGYDAAPLLERMLIEHVVLCYFRLSITELQFSAVTSHGGTFAQVGHYQRLVGAAQKRFTRAAESLARVRKLSRLSVQINIAAEGGQQVNVA